MGARVCQAVHFLGGERAVLLLEEVLVEFSATVRPMINRAHRSQNREFTQFWVTLLPRLITGQMRLPEVQV
jgi:hypothetical protein